MMLRLSAPSRADTPDLVKENVKDKLELRLLGVLATDDHLACICTFEEAVESLRCFLKPVDICLLPL